MVFIPNKISSALTARSFRDPETGLHLVFLTNNFTLSATMIAALYKSVGCGTVFQMDKAKFTHQAFLRHFRERRENSNLIAVCVYVLAAIIKIDLALDVSLYTFYRFCRFTLLRKPSAQALFDGASSSSPSTPSNQPNLFTNNRTPVICLHLITLRPTSRDSFCYCRNETSPTATAIPATGVRSGVYNSPYFPAKPLNISTMYADAGGKLSKAPWRVRPRRRPRPPQRRQEGRWCSREGAAARAAVGAPDRAEIETLYQRGWLDGRAASRGRGRRRPGRMSWRRARPCRELGQPYQLKLATGRRGALDRAQARDRKFRRGADIRRWRLLADGGYVGQRPHYRGHIASAGQGRNDPARITAKCATINGPRGCPGN